MTQKPAAMARAAAMLLITLAFAGAAHAAGCTVSATGLSFGAYQPLTFPGKVASTVVTSDASISVACTGIVTGGSFSIALGPSTSGSGDRITTRYLSNSNGGDDMAFNVYLDPSHFTVWGDGITGGSTIGGTIAPGDSNQSMPVYGRVTAGQSTLRGGTFSDTLTMTLTYSP